MRKAAYLLFFIVLLASGSLFLTLFNTATAQPSYNSSGLLTPAPTVEPASTPSTTPTIQPTPVPTTKIVPGSPLAFGSQFFTEMISQFDITKVAELVLVLLAVVWVVVILVYVDREFVHKGGRKQEKSA